MSNSEKGKNRGRFRERAEKDDRRVRLVAHAGRIHHQRGLMCYSPAAPVSLGAQHSYFQG